MKKLLIYAVSATPGMHLSAQGSKTKHFPKSHRPCSVRNWDFVPHFAEGVRPGSFWRGFSGIWDAKLFWMASERP